MKSPYMLTAMTRVREGWRLLLVVGPWYFRKGLFPVAFLFVLILPMSLACSQRRLVEPPEKSADEAKPSSSLEGAWIFHPKERGRVNDRLDLGDSVLEVDSFGSRWLVKKDAEPEVSAFGVSESLVAIHREGGQFFMIGESGKVYISKEALGPFVQTRLTPQPLLHTQRVGQTLVSISRRGRLFRSIDLGRSWQESDRSEFFVELSLALDGSILAFSVPEQWYRSTDQGQSFELLDVEAMAPRELARQETGALVVRGLLQDYRYKEERFVGELARNSRVAEERRQGLRLSRFARASDLLRGAAHLRGERYLFLRKEKVGDSWKLEEGLLGGRLTEAPVEGLEGCEGILLAKNGDKAFVVCEDSSKGEGGELRLYLSQDGAHSFERINKLFRGELKRVVVDVSRSGQVAIGGLCPQEESERGCAIQGITLLDSLSEVKTLHLPSLPEAAALAFDPKGRLWAVGGRKKDGHTLLLGPIEGGPEVVGLMDLTREAKFPPMKPRSTSSFSVPRNSGSGSRKAGLQLTFDKEGLMSVTLVAAKKGFIANLDSSGRLLASAEAPSGGSALHGAGRYLVALSFQDSVLWESVSGGLSWTQHELPRKLCPRGFKDCQTGLSCSSAGCLVGDELIRMGFGFEVEKKANSSSEEKLQEKSYGVRDGYVCRARSDDWVDLPGISAVPGVNDVALGPAAWAQVQSDRTRASAMALQVRWGSSKLESRTLLAPVVGASSYVFHVSQQVEGSAVLRYRLPTSGPKPYVNLNTPVSVELAWDNRIEDLIGKGKLSDVAEVRALPLATASRESVERRPDLISVAGRGLYFRLSRSLLPSSPLASSRSTHFLRLSSGGLRREELPALVRLKKVGSIEGEDGVPWIPKEREEWLQVGGEHVPLFLLAGAHALVRVEGQKQHPYLMAPLKSENTDIFHAVKLAYRGKRIGFVSMQMDIDGKESRASFVELGDDRAFEIPVPVPLQSDLKSKVVSCELEQRQDSARVVAPGSDRVSREVLMFGLGTKVSSFVTESAVLFGTRGQPCVAAFQAVPVASGEESQVSYRALVYPGKKNLSWIFRSVSQSSANKLVSVRSLSCAVSSSKRAL